MGKSLNRRGKYSHCTRAQKNGRNKPAKKKMSEIKIKSNGLRNELKEIRKSIDKLTEIIMLQQTYKRYEKNNDNDPCCSDVKLCKCEKRKDS